MMYDDEEATWQDCLFVVLCATASAFCLWKAVTSDCEALPSGNQNMPEGIK